MSDYCIVVIGGAQARFFTLEPVEFPELESGPRLEERGAISNPEKEMPGRDLYTDPKTGRSRAPRGGPSHGYDDHRSQHEDEFDRRFARKVMEETVRLAQKTQASCMVLAAPARMLGLLRQDIEIIAKSGMEVRKVGKDMTKFSTKQIHDHLAKKELLPACRRPRI